MRVLSGISPSVIVVMWRRELLRYRRDLSQLFGGFSRTILWLVILGLGLGAALREIEGYTYAQFILPGVITLNVLFASMQCAVALVWDRQVGLLREVVISPAPMLSVALGKLLGGATIALVQGSIPFLFMPLLGVEITLSGFLLALVMIFLMGITLTGVGIFLASRLRTFEGFGAISNGVIQPLYFLSGSIFPIRGVVGGVGFLDIPEHLRAELRQFGIYAIGGGWLVQLPVWLQVLVYANPVSYMLDSLRFVLLDFRQLPLALDLGVLLLSPPVAVVVSAHAMQRMITRR